jgi:hypothetical protein
MLFIFNKYVNILLNILIILKNLIIANLTIIIILFYFKILICIVN